ncbi:MAG: MMPL family transporter [Jatrophihabitantaceae bacterium]
MNRLIRQIADVSIRRPWLTITSWVLAAAFVLGLAGAFGGSLVDNFVAAGSESDRGKVLLEQRFPGAAAGSALAVFAVDPGQRLDSHRPAIEAALARIARTGQVSLVADPFQAGTVARDGRIGYATITFDVPSQDLGPAALAAVSHAIEPAAGAGLTAELGGDAAFINAPSKHSSAEAIGLLAALVILVVAFGTIVAALVPIALALIAVAAGLGAITLLANGLNVSTAAPTIGAMIGLGVGIDYSLFIVARYRENRTAGQDNATALSAAMGTSGSAVVVAGGTVIVAMLALVLTGVGVLTSIGLGTSLVVLFAVTTALTLLPALLTLLGNRIDAGRLVGRRRPARRTEDSAWWRYAHRVSRRPWPYLVAAAAVLLTLAAPSLGMRTGFPNSGDNSTTTSDRRAYDLLTEGFGPGFSSPLLIVADLHHAGVDAATIPLLAKQIAADPGIAAVSRRQVSPDGFTIALPAVPTTGATSPATAATLDRLRALAPDGVYVTGLPALTHDLTKQLNDTFPIFIAAILAATFLLLMFVFRSIVVALKAVVLNLLSIGAAYGVVVAVFQWGWLGGLFNLDRTYLIASPLPPIFFAVLFGLSVDYEVFLLSRIRAEYDATGDNTESVARGLASTGRVITSAALVMTVVFVSFIADPSPFVKMIGLGLATAIALDATLVRMVLVPASMALLGQANWWLPSWLDRLLPQVNLDGAGRPEVLAEPKPALAGSASL